ncbi:MAG: PepSY domain-containing protein [Chromatiales bacterium]|nr:PepSY domain-containing protein [Chromatiales bacterium]
MIRRFRDQWLALHKWVALTIGVWIILNGLSGSILVFQRELEAAINPHLYRTDQAITGTINLDAMEQAVKAAFPDYWIVMVDRDNLVANEAFRFQIARNGEAASYFTNLEVFIDPATTEILGSRPYFTFIKAVKMFHFELLGGRTTKVVMGFMGLAFLAMMLAGAVLWWPGRKKLLRSLRFKTTSQTPRLIRDIHTVFGVYFLVVLLMVCVTGLVVIFPQQSATILGVFTDATATARPTAPPTLNQNTPPSLNELAQTVNDAYPDSTLVLLLYPGPKRGWYTFRVEPAGADPTTNTVQVYVDQYTGKIADVFDPGVMPPARSFIGLWSVYSHNGKLYGMPGRVLVFSAGIGLCVMFGTGLYIWLRKRRLSVPSSSVVVLSQTDHGVA